MGINILVVDDEKRIRKLIGDYLRNDGYGVVEAENGMEAIEKFYSNTDISLIILDVTMPRMNGWEVCKDIRKESDIPIIFLTALGEWYDEAKGLEMGADDYIVKPFRYEVFIARVRSILRKVNKASEGFYHLGKLEVNTNSRTVKYEGASIDMSPKEYELLIYLINNKNIALERDQILDAVWGHDFYGDKRTVDTRIKNIRAKIGLAGNYIKTIRGVGYKLEVDII